MPDPWLGLGDQEGRLGDPRIPVSECSIPDYVALDDAEEQLLWAVVPRPDSPGENETFWPGSETFQNLIRSRRESQGAIDRFLKIETPAQVKAFAKSYGVLGLCQHQMPSSHDEACTPSRLPAGDGEYSLTHCEPVARWLEFVKAARATLRLAIAVRKGRTGEEEDWRQAELVTDPAISDGLLQALIMFSSRHLINARAGVSAIVYRWLECGDVRPYMNWDNEQPALQLAASALKPPLFGILASQLMLTTAESSELMECTACGKLYSRGKRRRPKPGQNNYCLECSQGKIPDRNRQRKHQKRRQIAWIMNDLIPSLWSPHNLKQPLRNATVEE